MDLCPDCKHPWLWHRKVCFGKRIRGGMIVDCTCTLKPAVSNANQIPSEDLPQAKTA
jgi:hypothetical protein